MEAKAQELLQKQDIVGLAEWISQDDVDDALDNLRAKLADLSIQNLGSDNVKNVAAAAKVLALGAASGAEELEKVSKHLTSIIAGLKSGDEDAQGFCAALLGKLARKGFIDAILSTPGALGSIVSILENPSVNVDVGTSCIHSLVSLCKKGNNDVLAAIDNALGKKTFTALLAHQESELQNGAFLLMSHVSRLDSTRNNLVSDVELVRRIVQSFSNDELCAHAANAFKALAMDDRAVAIAAEPTNKPALDALAKAVEDQSYHTIPEVVTMGVVMSQLSRQITFTAEQESAVHKIVTCLETAPDDFEDVAIRASDFTHIGRASPTMQEFVYWVFSKLSIAPEVRKELAAVCGAAIDAAASSSNEAVAKAAASAKKALL